MFAVMEKDVPSCPIARAALIVGSRWTAQILRELLAHDTRRFSDFAGALGEIPPNTLSQRLKMLEESGILERSFYEEHPPRAEYRLTDKGRKMGSIIKAMRDWGAKYG